VSPHHELVASVPPTKRVVAFRGVLGLRSGRQTTHLRAMARVIDVLGKAMEPGNNRQKIVINQEQINHLITRSRWS
jgi:hypothetical protein